MHCCLATGGPGAAMRHAPFGRPRHPLGTFPCGKVPRPPAGGRNLPQETDFLWRAMERSLLSFFCFAEDFASAEATKGLSGRPLETFGSPCSKREAGGTAFLWKARERAFLARGFRLCGGDQRAFRSPFGNLRRPPVEADGSHKKQISCGGQGKRAFLSFFCFAEDFASAEATREAFRSPPGPLRGISISDRALPIGCFYAYWPKNTKTTNQPPLPHFLHYFGKDIGAVGIHLSCPAETTKEQKKKKIIFCQKPLYKLHKHAIMKP